MSTSRRTSPARDVDAVAGRLHTVALHLLRRLRSEDEAFGVSPPRLSALSVVVRAGPITIGELAAAERVRPPTMTRLVDGLEGDGLVTREPHPDDRRSVRVRVTAKGKRVSTGGRSRRASSLAGHLRDLAPRDLETLSRATELLERTLRETRD